MPSVAPATDLMLLPGADLPTLSATDACTLQKDYNKYLEGLGDFDRLLCMLDEGPASLCSKFGSLYYGILAIIRHHVQMPSLVSDATAVNFFRRGKICWGVERAVYCQIARAGTDMAALVSGRATHEKMATLVAAAYTLLTLTPADKATLQVEVRDRICAEIAARVADCPMEGIKLLVKQKAEGSDEVKTETLDLPPSSASAEMLDAYDATGGPDRSLRDEVRVLMAAMSTARTKLQGTYFLYGMAFIVQGTPGKGAYVSAPECASRMAAVFDVPGDGERVRTLFDVPTKAEDALMEAHADVNMHMEVAERMRRVAELPLHGVVMHLRPHKSDGAPLLRAATSDSEARCSPPLQMVAEVSRCPTTPTAAMRAYFDPEHRTSDGDVVALAVQAARQELEGSYLYDAAEAHRRRYVVDVRGALDKGATFVVCRETAALGGEKRSAPVGKDGAGGAKRACYVTAT